LIDDLLAVLRRTLADDNAASLVAEVAAGKTSPWLLGWVPLMQGGGESGIIGAWRQAAEQRLSDERNRADLRSLSLVFAALAGCRPAWDHGLGGWNMKTSPFLDEIRAESREESRAEGALALARALVLRLGRQKFGKAPTKKQQKALATITDVAQLEALAERLLGVDSWAELFGEA
jgi:hypothetical protein